jgi:hypothetical protein
VQAKNTLLCAPYQDNAAQAFQWSGWLIAGACLCWGIDNNLTRKLSASDPVQIAMLGPEARVIFEKRGFKVE